MAPGCQQLGAVKEEVGVAISGPGTGLGQTLTDRRVPDGSHPDSTTHLQNGSNHPTSRDCFEAKTGGPDGLQQELAFLGFLWFTWMRLGSEESEIMLVTPPSTKVSFPPPHSCKHPGTVVRGAARQQYTVR